ncbi:MAG: thioredoxin family protein [Victivallales bacterium]|nr:thioredoxin family protein [Victivallales bacterium]
MRTLLLTLFALPAILLAELATFKPVIRQEAEVAYLDLHLEIAQSAHIFAESFAVRFPQGVEASLARPLPTKTDPDTESQVLEGTPTIRYLLSPPVPQEPFNITIDWQGCSGDVCLLPQSTVITVNGDGTTQSSLPTVSPATSTALGGFKVVATATGYLSPKQFLDFCQKAEQSAQNDENILLAATRKYGIWLALLLLLPLGAMLNLTPCVLPMLPINLAIIGATGDGISRGKGLLNSGLYGLGMALSYGLLGIVTVLTGAQFGSINHSPVFNLCIALLFILLGLAMLDIFSIDLARFRHRIGIGGPIGAFLMGCLAAILAGACVAPVLIWALLLATSQYSQGNPAGLFIPFVLGVGMALPWPVLAIGLAKIPRPGAWMITIRRLFALLIFIFAVYYGVVAYRLLKTGSSTGPLPGWSASYEEACQKATDNQVPLLLVFSGRACKACDAMHATTFQDSSVNATIDSWAKVLLLADDPEDKTATALATELKLVGTPTCFILKR